MPDTSLAAVCVTVIIAAMIDDVEPVVQEDELSLITGTPLLLQPFCSLSLEDHQSSSEQGST